MTLLIPMKVPSLNELLRMHWAKRRNMKKEWGQFMLPFKEKIGKAVYTHVYIMAKRTRLLDYDNLVGGAKECVIDNLKDFRWINNDDPGSVTVVYEQCVAKKNCTEIILTK